MRSPPFRRAARFAGAAALALPVAVAAQNLPPDESIRFTRYTAIGDRYLAGYETPGVPIGSFTLSPALEVAANATDNVLAQQTGRRSDVAAIIAPSAQLSSNWTGTSLTLSADGNFTRYANNSSEDINAVNASAYATQEFAGQGHLRLLGRFRANRESRESQNAFALTRRPIAYTQAVGAVGLDKQFGNVRLAGEAGIQQLDFRDGELVSGGVLDQDYRDGTVRSVRGRADVIQSPAVAYFVQGTYTSSSYSQLSYTGTRRGADTTEILAGARFELPILARGEIGLGYIDSSYRDQRFRRFAGLAVNSRVTFFPSQLTNVTVNAVRSVNDAGTPDSSTYVALSGGVRVDHELLRSLVIGAGAQFERDRYNGVDRSDGRLTVTANANYRLNRTLTFRVSADRLDLSSDGTARYKSFTRDRLLVGLGVRL